MERINVTSGVSHRILLRSYCCQLNFPPTVLASKETLSLDEIYKAHNEINQIKQALERQALFGEGRLPVQEVGYREREHNYLYYQLALTARTVTIYDFIGKPFCPPIDGLSDKRVSLEVDRLLLLLAQNGIEISISDPHSNADDRKLYSFLINMVLKRSVKDIRLPGVCYNIDYNYYCPDYTHSCIFIADELLSGLFEHDNERFESCLSPHFFVNNNPLGNLYQTVIDKFDNFRAFLDYHLLVGWTIEGIDLDDNHRKAVVHLALHYGLKNNKKLVFTNRGRLVCYGNESNWWFIHRIDWPGLSLE
jgi:hypothetical protein